ncbi:LEAF RUST 10 DISEASE-RESISTANCE LOCUS RECEPTOR-LIKE PROTEIN KINASE-like 2.4 [Quercus lobata]|uniref:LEAF RUST 10 DISEASE-RESISTANCE LOCUS RECEPTOR-LIKE PROTEIN KINASE-like 2.4 n=1 Tax=Quercus lobata TaxID=97700 RepID=UPI001244CA5E|nr:LEAF RUST 10 DISEASE-RESISTANCE LOCUS RECEPTOR-LIKE PROTEIN KINASE-like 2.4 [Quercus lobata]
MGYIAPEVLSRNFGTVSHKLDVFSFGMLLLEIVARRKNIDTTVENTSQMSRRSSKGKDIVTDDPSTPVAKRTRLSSQSSQDSNLERFRTPLTSHIYSNIFDRASPIVERWLSLTP